MITEHNEKGAMGFVINKLFSKKFNELVAFKDSSPLPLYAGGPVDKENLFCLHIRPDLVDDSQLLFDSVYMGGNFQETVEHINNGQIKATQIKLFIGYCGWDNDELEKEIEEGSWLIVTADKNLVFTDDITTLWENLLKRSL